MLGLEPVGADGRANDLGPRERVGLIADHVGLDVDVTAGLEQRGAT